MSAVRSALGAPPTVAVSLCCIPDVSRLPHKVLDLPSSVHQWTGQSPPPPQGYTLPSRVRGRDFDLELADSQDG